MNPREILLHKLRRNDLDYTIRAREALLNADEALRMKDINFSRILINEFVFDMKTGRLNSTQELQLVVILLTDFFLRDDPSQLALFFNIFEIGKNSRKSVLLKFIICAIGIQSKPALNSSGTYLLDASNSIRVSADLGRALISEIQYFACNNLEKLKMLPALSPMFTNALCLMLAENFKDQLPPPVFTVLLTEFISFSSPSPPIIYTFTIPTHVENGSLILSSLFRFTILSELLEEKSSYSKMHLKVLECLTNIDITTPSKPIIYTKYLDNIADLILRAQKNVDAERVQRSMEKFAQIVQITKPYLYGNDIPMLMEKLRNALPKNALMDLVMSQK